jgi:multiple antibiotic resistance protein
MSVKDFIEIWFNAFLGLFAILNPLGNLGLFVDNTKGLSARDRFKVFNLSVMVAFVTLLVLTFTGKWIMVNVFKISIEEFKIAGGVLLTVIGVERILKSKKSESHDTPENVYEMAVVPLAIPLLVGPGAIATSILIFDRDGAVVAAVSLLAVFAATWIILQASPWIDRLMGRFGTMVISRILFIFITAIGVHFLLSGLAAYFGVGFPGKG